MKLLHKGGRRDYLKNNRSISIISVMCKRCMMMVREIIHEWAEDSGLLGEVHGAYRKGRHTEDNFPDSMLLAVHQWTARDLSMWFSIGPTVAAVLGIC